MEKHNKDQDSSSKTKLCLKIKIPNTIKEAPVEKQEQVAQQVQDYGGNINELHNNLPPGYRVCGFCGKVFSSGKAWGGHKRHHLKILRENNSKKNQELLKVKKHRSYSDGCGDGHKNNIINKGDVKLNRDRKPTCCLCGKKFPSMKSIFGHMRFHSDRDLKSNSNFSSRFEFEEAEDEEIYYNKISPVQEKGCVDLMTCLVNKGWGKRDLRGRASLTDLIPQAARDLLTLSKAQGRLALTSPGSKAFKDNVMEIGKKLNYISKLRDLEAAHKISKMPNVDQGSGEDDDDAAVPMETTFDCDVCDKTFSTGQALGGHKRCHWKHFSNGSSSSEAGHHHGMLGIDLNQPYVMQDGDEETSFSSDED